MGTWGYKLYQDDLAADIRDYYNDRLREGKKGTEITQELLSQYQATRFDADEAPVFWFALSDTQWNLGRLEDTVKETALEYIRTGADQMRWERENPKAAARRREEIEKLKQKLLSPQPPEKKVSQHRLYRCEWKPGDVFAYRIESERAKQKGLYGQFFLIQKVDEGTWYPGHIVPIVYVKITNNATIPETVEAYDSLEFVQTCFTKYEERFWPINMSCPQEDIARKSKIEYVVDEYGLLPQYRAELLSTSKKIIPSKLIYVGNFAAAQRPKNEFIPHSKLNIIAVSWKEFEEKLISLYYGNNNREFGIYATPKASPH